MWPMLLNLTRDECRQTLRRLELEAYSNMISVLRAQGALEDNRKKLLEELRAVLHISSDRHSAEARRVSNDELLATIAHHISGPNTGLGWICEGRRKVPLMPRGIPQTAYTEMADKTSEALKEESKELKKLDADKLVVPKTNEEELQGPEGETAEAALSTNEIMDEIMYPIAMEDQTSKLWETELINRKRKVLEGSSIPDDTMPPIKNMRNIPVNTNQKHLNLSQIYSKYSQSATSKSSGQSKHSYNQVSKVSTSKSSQPRAHKHRAHKQSKNAQMALSKQAKKAQEAAVAPGKQFSSGVEYTSPPGSFQASYTQSIMSGKIQPEYMEDLKLKGLSSPGMVSDSPTMQLLTQPATAPHELAGAALSDPSLQAQTPTSKHSKHSHQFLIKGRRPDPDKKVQMSDMKVLQKPEGIKVLSNRQVVVAPGSAQKALGKVATAKVVGSTPRAPPLADKMIVVSKPLEHKSMNSKIVVTSSAMRTPSKDAVPAAASVSPKPEAFTPKGIPATDLKVSAKTFVLNQKPGQKMVVLPAKARTKPGSDVQIPLLHFKGLPSGVKLVPVSSQSLPPVTKAAAVTVVSKPASAVGTPSVTPKVLGIETIKTANLADIVPVKGLTPVSTPKITNPIVRPASAKGSVIVVQKGATIGKALSFTKNGNDMSKIIMGKNVNQLLQANKPEQAEASQPGNVIVLELNNDQAGRATTMSEILDSRAAPPRTEEPKQPASDTPVLFDSAVEGVTVPACDTELASSEPVLSLPKEEDVKSKDDGKDSSSVTDWEMELDTVSRKGKDDEDKLNSLHLDLGMSSDSDAEYLDDRKAETKRTEEIADATPSGERGEVYGAGLALATRTLLSQLQDEGSSSSDSSFALRRGRPDAESAALSEAKEKLSEKVAEARSRRRRIDVFSTAIGSHDINLDAFSYLDDVMADPPDVPLDKH